MKMKIRPSVKFEGIRAARFDFSEHALFAGHWLARAYYPKENPLDPNEPLQLKWEEAWKNLVVNQGLNHLLDVTLSAATQLTAWYLLLVNGASPTIAAADTYASHGGWSENTAYSQATRPAWTDAGASSQSITNSASPATFSINSNGQTIGGAALVSDSTKGDTAASGARLYAAGTFSSAKALDSGETLTVTATFTAADDGV